MWSCMACAATIRFRMYWAFMGISRPSAFSTARTDAIACTVVQTPQNRCVNSQASRGSRPSRIVSMPRNICPEDQAFWALPPSTSTSMRRCPSMRVTGSTVMRLAMVLPLPAGAHGDLYRCSAAQNGEQLHDDDVSDDLQGHETHGDHELGDGREVVNVVARAIGHQVGVEAVEPSREHHEH